MIRVCLAITLVRRARVRVLESGLGCSSVRDRVRVWGVSGLWLRLEPGCSRQDQGLGLRVTVSVLGSGFRVRGLGFRVCV